MLTQWRFFQCCLVISLTYMLLRKNFHFMWCAIVEDFDKFVCYFPQNFQFYTKEKLPKYIFGCPSSPNFGINFFRNHCIPLSDFLNYKYCSTQTAIYHVREQSQWPCVMFKCSWPHPFFWKAKSHFPTANEEKWLRNAVL